MELRSPPFHPARVCGRWTHIRARPAPLLGSWRNCRRCRSFLPTARATQFHNSIGLRHARVEACHGSQWMSREEPAKARSPTRGDAQMPECCQLSRENRLTSSSITSMRSLRLIARSSTRCLLASPTFGIPRWLTIPGLAHVGIFHDENRPRPHSNLIGECECYLQPLCTSRDEQEQESRGELWFRSEEAGSTNIRCRRAVLFEEQSLTPFAGHVNCKF